MRKSRLFVPALFTLFLPFCGCQNQEAPLAYAPDFRLNTFDGRRFYLNAQRNKTVLLIFWSTDCLICKTQMVALRALHGDKVVVAAICVDRDADFGLVKSIVDKLDLHYPVLMDSKGRVAAMYGVNVLPVTVIVGPNGRLQARHEGYDANVRQRIDRRIERLR
jgi:peroxiredoxin